METANEIEFPVEMEQISPNTQVTVREPSHLEKKIKVLNEELSTREDFIREQERKFMTWVEKERRESERAMEDKADMIRELTQEVYKVMSENHILKKELQNMLKEIHKERKANEIILKERTKKEKEALVCFSAALEAKNRVLDKLDCELKTKHEELEKLKIVADAQKTEFKASIEILEEKRRIQIEQKENEIQNLIVQMNHIAEVKRRSSSPSSHRFLPMTQLNPNIEKKKKFAQKQAEAMCQLMQTQTENHVTFVQQIENTFTQMNRTIFGLKKEVEDLKCELEKKDEIVKSLEQNLSSVETSRKIKEDEEEVSDERSNSGGRPDRDDEPNELSNQRTLVDQSLREYLDFSWVEEQTLDNDVDDDVNNQILNKEFTGIQGHSQSTPVKIRSDRSCANELKTETSFDGVIKGVLSYLRAKIDLMEEENLKMKGLYDERNLRDSSQNGEIERIEKSVDKGKLLSTAEKNLMDKMSQTSRESSSSEEEDSGIGESPRLDDSLTLNHLKIY